MAKLQWGSIEPPEHEMGVDRGVLYVQGKPGVAWNGLTSMNLSPSGGQPRPFYIDGQKYLNLSSQEEFGGTISSFFSPPEFDECDGAAFENGVRLSQQYRRAFGFCFRSKTASGYKLHLIYDATASPTTRSYASLTDDPSTEPLSWSFTTRGVETWNHYPVSYIWLDSEKAESVPFAALEEILYGKAGVNPRLPSPNQILSMFGYDVPFIVTDNLDGSFTVSGSDEMVDETSNGGFAATSPTAIMVSADEFELSTYIGSGGF